MTKTRFGYTLLLYLLLPKILAHLVWRAWRQPAYLRHIPERFGFYTVPAQRVIWVHAVSVGETRAAQPLIQRLRERYPQHQILLTHMTPTGRETGQAVFGDTILQSYLPYDFPFAVKRFLRHFKPVVGVLMETEIWFNLIRQAKLCGTPLYLVNARLSEKSAENYSRIPKLVRPALRSLAEIGAQAEEDAERLRGLGAQKISVTGNIKFDIAPADSALALGRELRECFGLKRPILLFASTREGEEALILDQLNALSIRDLLIVIVPRHPQRFDEVAALIQKRGVKFQRRSVNNTIGQDTAIVLGDTMGEMFSYYAACDIAVIGGSLLSYGAQNLIEACAVGVPVIIGPHVYNFSEVTKLALDAGAAIQVQNAEEAIRVAVVLFEDKQKREEIGRAGLAFSKQHQGAADKTLKLLRF